MKTQGFKFIRDNAREVVIQHPNGDYNKVTKGNYTTLEDYAENTVTPFKLDENGKRVYDTEAFYLEYVNNFITIERIAEHYGITEGHAIMLIDAGRTVNHKK